MVDNSKNFENDVNPDTAIIYNEPIWKIWKHKRYIIAILAFFGFVNVYALRSNLSIAVVDMTTLKYITLENGTTILKREFEWDSTLKGYILSSFFYGYILTQILGGYLATKLGGARVFGFGVAATSFFTIITPWVVKTNVYFFIAVRIIEGAFEGVTFPAIQEVWSHWAPPSDKSRLVSIALSGGYFGAVIAMPLCSLLATAFGWKTIFFTFGTIGLVWYLMWVIVVRDTPADDSRINPEEYVYITEAISKVKSNVKADIPWFNLLTSTSVIAHTICLSCEGWGFHTMLTYMPQIMNSLLGFDLNKSGFLSGLPYLVTSIMVQASGHLADFLLARGYLSTTNIRKLCIIFGFLGQAVFMLSAGYWVSSIGTPFCLIVGVGCGGAALGSLAINPLDIAPKFASVIFGISNTFATIPGIVTPILTGYLVTDPTSLSQWRTIFFISSGVYFFGILVSLFFTTGERQSWAEPSENNIKNNLRDKTCSYNNRNSFEDIKL